MLLYNLFIQMCLYPKGVCPPPSPRGGRGAPGNSPVYSALFLEPFEMLFWSPLVWLHWVSTLPKVPPKRHNSEVQKLPSQITVNCTPAMTGTPLSLLRKVIKLFLFEHFSRSILWRLNLNPFGFIHTGMGRKVLQSGSPLRQSN